eukprot:PhM_4_TR1071/c0_g1_i1/m.26885/K10841/ERCC6, CSB, RAD26; DNA excision repair protein ERCC-6
MSEQPMAPPELVGCEELLVAQVAASEVEHKVRKDIEDTARRAEVQRLTRSITSLKKDLSFQTMRLRVEDDKKERETIRGRVTKMESELEGLEASLGALESGKDVSAVLPTRERINNANVCNEASSEVRLGEITPFQGSSNAKGVVVPQFTAMAQGGMRPGAPATSFLSSTPSTATSFKASGTGSTAANPKLTGRSSMTRFVKRAKVGSGMASAIGGLEAHHDDGDDERYMARLSSMHSQIQRMKKQHRGDRRRESLSQQQQAAKKEGDDDGVKGEGVKREVTTIDVDDDDDLTTSGEQSPAPDVLPASTAEDGGADMEREFLAAFGAAVEHQAEDGVPVTEVASMLEAWTHDPKDEANNVRFDGGLSVPVTIWYQLFDYQRVCVQWLWELHCLGVGGVLADEMGLGKTVQMAVFLGALHYSGLSEGSTIIVCPATILAQWVRELHFWAPMLRVNVLHATGTHRGTTPTLLGNVSLQNGVVVTTYAMVRDSLDHFLSTKINYVVLDEGHLIRNPEAATSIACKAIPTAHRILMTGTPIQNRLVELWSLFNFIHPKLLGTHEAFVEAFDKPIKAGSYRSATPQQVQYAYEYSRTLKALIAPFLLRRMKADVGMMLPPKTEQVLLCKLTQEQVDMYASYLMSEDVAYRIVHRHDQNALSRKPMMMGPDTSGELLFQALTVMRKICNHPWLVRPTHLDVTKDDISTAHECSGKLKVLLALLDSWKTEGRKAIVFSQTRSMLDIIEAAVKHHGSEHIRLDGGTPIAHRLPLIDAFNNDPSVFVALMTTRVGGVGVNLIGASRVVIFDPDWNPITDVQARERVWRLGQRNDVLVYRLLSVGTVEEKIYQRQIYKLCAMESVLGNEKYQRLFTNEQLADLFTLGAEYDNMLHGEARRRFGADGRTGDSSKPETLQVLGGEVLSTELVAKAEDALKDEDSQQQSSNGGGGDSQGSNTSILKNLMDSRSVAGVASHDSILARSTSGAGGSGRQSSAFKAAMSARQRLADSTQSSHGSANRPKHIPPQMPNNNSNNGN